MVRSDRAVDGRGHGDLGRSGARFVVRFVVALTIAQLAWPLLGGTYGRALAGGGNRLAPRSLWGGQVRFEHRPSPSGLDFRVVLGHRATGAAAQIERSSRYTSYGPASFVAALVIATPLPWRRRLRALMWGQLLVHLLLALTLALMILDAFSNGDALAIVELPPIVKAAVALSALHLGYFETLPYVAAFVVWGIATFRRGDWGLVTAPPRSPGRSFRRAEPRATGGGGRRKRRR